MQVLRAPDNKLRVTTIPVRKITAELIKLTQEMAKLTKTFIDPEGVGLASTQIGKSEQFFVAKKGKKFVAIFNPKILFFGKKTKVFFEGCLSIPDYYGEVTRPTTVTVEYLNIKGEKVKEQLNGVDAWIFQHEYDHLQGRLFVDLALEQKAKMYKVIGRDRAGAEVFEEIKL